MAPMPLARPSLPFRLMLITSCEPGQLGQTRLALAHIPPGRVALQLRDKQASPAKLEEAARNLRQLTRSAQCLLLINGDVELAARVGADGVHLPEKGPAPEAARERLGANAIVGLSRHDARGILSVGVAADYVCLSPIHAVPGKTGPLGVAGFARLARLTPRPVLALGGVRPDDVDPLLAAGAAGIAVIRAVMAAESPAAKVGQFLTLLDPSERFPT